MLSLAAMASMALAGPPPCASGSGTSNSSEEKVVIPVPVVPSPTKPLTPKVNDSGDYIVVEIGPRFEVPFVPMCIVEVTLAGGPYDPYFLIECGTTDLGVSYVEMENLTTGETAGTHRAQAGAVRIPVNSPAGRWWIVVKSATGEYYSGVFTVEAFWWH